MSNFFRWINLLLFLIGMLFLAGCGGMIPKSSTPTPDAALTQIAKSVEALRDDLSRIAPTLTAAAELKPLENTPLPEVNATNTAIGGSGPTVTPTAQTGQPAIASPDAPLGASTAVSATPASKVPFSVRGVILALSSPTPVADTDSTLFKDDFSTKRGWFTNESDSYTLEFEKGGYRFLVLSMTNPIWSVRSNPYNDVRIEVDAAQTAGSSDGYYGLVCRYEDGDNYYVLVVSPDGSFGIGKVRYGELSFLAFTDQYPGLLTPLGNRLRADCVGNTLSLYVNGTKVLDAMDYDFVSGQVGMVAGNRSTPGTDVQFDNFIVLKP
jgi:enamine deaminase RidA (YjgF/YER057c/UK114 family)